jgi:bifunctional N-acetylglucosamine-1-phosphate-uridyltransferase/glucosamine-1-phosphate-acetyltransferase GlmU-like protein
MYSLLVAAAGLGTRMSGELPKALVPWQGRPLIETSISSLAPFADEIVVIVRPEAEPLFMQHMSRDLLHRCRFATQEIASGTSWAVSLGLRECRSSRTIVVWADHVGASRFSSMQVSSLLNRAEVADIVVPIVHRKSPYAYFELQDDGSIFEFRETRRGAQRVEFGWSDCGTFLVRTSSVSKFLGSHLVHDNEPDSNFLSTFSAARDDGLRVETVEMPDLRLTVGINSQEDLHRLSEESWGGS